jgi:hypothetical protein
LCGRGGPFRVTVLELPGAWRPGGGGGGVDPTSPFVSLPTIGGFDPALSRTGGGAGAALLDDDEGGGVDLAPAEPPGLEDEEGGGGGGAAADRPALEEDALACPFMGVLLTGGGGPDLPAPLAARKEEPLDEAGAAAGLLLLTRLSVASAGLVETDDGPLDALLLAADELLPGLVLLEGAGGGGALAPPIPGLDEAGGAAALGALAGDPGILGGAPAPGPDLAPGPDVDALAPSMIGALRSFINALADFNFGFFVMSVSKAARPGCALTAGGGPGGGGGGGIVATVDI